MDNIIPSILAVVRMRGDELFIMSAGGGLDSKSISLKLTESQEDFVSKFIQDVSEAQK